MRRVLLLALLGSGCTCLTQFDPESQPCEATAPVGEQCTEGFECGDAGLCRRIPDAGQ